ncbi:MAG TPA: glycoside hydrolase family 2 protein, partial [Dysgonamonadaceae bacterium]|nr:glycoside hydrolase family 2 protein [Dysgonamonadaceae bacterium]
VYTDGEYRVTLESNYLAKDVFIEIPTQGAMFSDNFFDLLPGEKKVVTIKSPQLTKDGKTVITIKHLRETY